jgi:hypothetical protein
LLDIYESVRDNTFLNWDNNATSISSWARPNHGWVR